jgi:integrase
MEDILIDPGSAATFIHPQVALIADQAANAATFADYHSRVDANTLRRQEDDLTLFARFLAEVGAISRSAADFGTELLFVARAWANMSHGLVAAFQHWLLGKGYAIGTVNVRLATVRRYCRLAHRAGVITREAMERIIMVHGYNKRQAHLLDEQRERNDIPTRVGTKKAATHILSNAQVLALKQQPDTPQGRRDALMLCLLADHGLRVGELAALEIGCIDLAAGTLSFYREKVHKHQTHLLSEDTLAAAQAYIASDALASGQLLRGSRKNGELWDTISTRAIRERVAYLGSLIGMARLSPHDLRHTWVKRAVRGKSDLLAVRDAGGWNSLAMPVHYAQSEEIANTRIKLDEPAE